MESKIVFIRQQKHSKEGPVLIFFPNYKALWESKYGETFVVKLDLSPLTKNKTNTKEI